MKTCISRRRLIQSAPFSLAGVSMLSRIPSPANARRGFATQSDLAEDQTLRLVGSTLPVAIHPQFGHSDLRPMLENSFRPAFVRDAQGDLLPGVCTDWSVTDDGLTYTFTIDPRATFSDGSKVTAEDLKFSWEYLADPVNQGIYLGYLTRIAGYEAVISGSTTELAGLLAVDDQTLRVTLQQPYTPFIEFAALYISGVVKKENVLSGGETWADNPVCCGPYQVEAWDRDSGEISWESNPYWWGEKPIIPRVTYRYVQDPNTQSIMWENDEMDLFQPSDALVAQMLQGLYAQNLQRIPYGGVYFYRLQSHLSPMDDPDIRRAFLKATDIETIVQAVFQGRQEPAYGLLSPYNDAYSDRPPYFDPDGARQALAASRYGDAGSLPPIAIRLRRSKDLDNMVAAMRQSWQDVLGVTVTIEPFNDSLAPEEETAQLVPGSAGELVTDPAGSVLNTGTEVSDSEIEEILATADALPLTRQDERIALYQRAENIAMDRAYYIPNFWVQYYFAVKPWVRNFATNTDSSLYTLPEMYLAKH